MDDSVAGIIVSIVVDEVVAKKLQGPIGISRRIVEMMHEYGVLFHDAAEEASAIDNMVGIVSIKSTSAMQTGMGMRSIIHSAASVREPASLAERVSSVYASSSSALPPMLLLDAEDVDNGEDGCTLYGYEGNVAATLDDHIAHAQRFTSTSIIRDEELSKKWMLQSAERGVVSQKGGKGEEKGKEAMGTFGDAVVITIGEDIDDSAEAIAQADTAIASIRSRSRSAVQRRPAVHSLPREASSADYYRVLQGENVDVVLGSIRQRLGGHLLRKVAIHSD